MLVSAVVTWNNVKVKKKVGIATETIDIYVLDFDDRAVVGSFVM